MPEEENNEEELDEETILAIQTADAQVERGEVLDFDEFAAEMRKRVRARQPDPTRIPHPPV